MAIIGEKNKGFALLIAVIFMSAMLSIGLALSSLAYKQHILASSAIDSQYAFYSADSALECALHEDQQNNLFAWPTSDPSSAPVMTCENLSPFTTPTKVWDSSHWVVSSRFAIESGKYCADVTVNKPKDVGTTFIFSEGYNVPCATVASPDGKRFLSRGIKSTYSTAAAIQDPGIEWVNQTSAADNSWNSVTYGNGMFVAVSSTNVAGAQRVMYSSDGVNWSMTGVSILPSTSSWNSVTFGNGKFVAVATGSTNRAMYSSDGITWTSIGTAKGVAANTWRSVTYGNGLFVAVASSGVGNRVMTSPDALTWTPRSAPDNAWMSVTFGNGLFVAVACGISATSCNSTVGNRIMTSDDGGINWITRPAINTNQWNAVTFGDGVFVAVSGSGLSTNRAMYSTDGLAWNVGGPATSQIWRSVTYGLGTFVAVATTLTTQVRTSTDGITWTLRNTPSPSRIWSSVTAGPDGFVAVSGSGTGNRVMTSGL